MQPEETALRVLPPLDPLPPLNALTVIQNAIDKNITGEQLALFVQSVERLEKMRAEKAFAAAFAAVQKDCTAIQKTKENKQTNSLYAELDVIQEKIVPIYTRHGFALSFGTADAHCPGDIRIVGTLTHCEGHSVTRFVDLPPDGVGIKGQANKTPLHARASTLTYGQRYLTVLMFNIRLTTKTDDDGNSDTLDTLIRDEALELFDLIEKKGVDRALFLQYASKVSGFEVLELEAIPRKAFAVLRTALLNKKPNGGGK